MIDKAERLAGYRHRRDHFRGPSSFAIEWNRNERRSRVSIIFRSAPISLSVCRWTNRVRRRRNARYPTTDGKTKAFCRVDVFDSRSTVCRSS